MLQSFINNLPTQNTPTKAQVAETQPASTLLRIELTTDLCLFLIHNPLNHQRDRREWRG
jgi:hypothetical protein